MISPKEIRQLLEKRESVIKHEGNGDNYIVLNEAVCHCSDVQDGQQNAKIKLNGAWHDAYYNKLMHTLTWQPNFTANTPLPHIEKAVIYQKEGESKQFYARPSDGFTRFIMVQ